MFYNKDEGWPLYLIKEEKVMAEKQIKQWITLKGGRHIPIFEGESKADVVKRLKEGVKKGKDTRPVPLKQVKDTIGEYAEAHKEKKKHREAAKSPFITPEEREQHRKKAQEAEEKAFGKSIDYDKLKKTGERNGFISKVTFNGPKDMQFKGNKNTGNKAVSKPATAKPAVTEESIQKELSRTATRLASKGYNTPESIEQHIRELSSIRKNDLAKKMGIGGRGEEKIKAMVAKIHEQQQGGKKAEPTKTWQDKDAETKAKQIANAEKQKAAAQEAQSNTKNYKYDDKAYEPDSESFADRAVARIEEARTKFGKDWNKLDNSQKLSIDEKLKKDRPDWYRQTLDHYEVRKATAHKLGISLDDDDAEDKINDRLNSMEYAEVEKMVKDYRENLKKATKKQEKGKGFHSTYTHNALGGKQNDHQYRVSNNNDIKSAIEDASKRIFDNEESVQHAMQLKYDNMEGFYYRGSPLVTRSKYGWNLSPDDVGGARKALIQAHYEVTGEIKKPGNKFNYKDKNIAKKVFEKSSYIMSQMEEKKTTAPANKTDDLDAKVDAHLAKYPALKKTITDKSNADLKNDIDKYGKILQNESDADERLKLKHRAMEREVERRRELYKDAVAKKGTSYQDIEKMLNEAESFETVDNDGKKTVWTRKQERRTDYLDRTEGGPGYSSYNADEWNADNGVGRMPHRDAARFIYGGVTPGAHGFANGTGYWKSATFKRKGANDFEKLFGKKKK